MKNSKILIIFITLCLGQYIVNAQPGVLDIVFKSQSGNLQEIITIENQIDDIVSISIFDDKNQVVHNTKHYFAKSDKVLCILPKNIYTVVIANVNKNKRLQTYQVNLE